MPVLAGPAPGHCPELPGEWGPVTRAFAFRVRPNMACIHSVSADPPEDREDKDLPSNKAQQWLTQYQGFCPEVKACSGLGSLSCSLVCRGWRQSCCHHQVPQEECFQFPSPVPIRLPTRGHNSRYFLVSITQVRAGTRCPNLQSQGKRCPNPVLCIFPSPPFSFFRFPFLILPSLPTSCEHKTP